MGISIDINTVVCVIYMHRWPCGGVHDNTLYDWETSEIYFKNCRLDASVTQPHDHMSTTSLAVNNRPPACLCIEIARVCSMSSRWSRLWAWAVVVGGSYLNIHSAFLRRIYITLSNDG